jgi:2'-5' RNA ligase
MPFAVEMYFDVESERRLRSLSDRCAALVGSAIIEGARPHISLGVADVVVHEEIEAHIVSFARRYKPFEITLSSVGFFTSVPSIAYLAPKVDNALLDLHAEFFERFVEGATGVWAHYFPRTWIPHCTLASGLDAKQSAQILEEVQRFGLPAECRIAEIGVVRFRPVVPILCREFAGPP